MVNPVAAREIRMASRSARTIWLAMGYLLALAAIVWWMWPDHAVFSLSAQSSRSILLVFVIVQVLLVLLCVPAFSAASIVGERENNSYDLLFATRLRPYEIMLGKLSSSLAMLLALVALSFPLCAACFFLGAVSGTEMLRLYAVSAVTAVLTGLLGLFVSGRARNSHQAMVRTYLLLLALTGVPWLPYALFLDVEQRAAWGYGLRALSPVAAVCSIVLPGFDRGGLDAGLPPSWWLYLAFAVVLSGLIGLYLCTVAVRSGGGRNRRPERVVDDPRELAKRRLRFPFYIIDPQRRRKPLSDRVNPVFAREFRGQAQGRGIYIFRGAYLCFALSCILMILLPTQMGSRDPALIKAVALAFQIGLVMLLVPSLSASAISQEVELRNVDNLRLSHIGPLQLISGKVQMALAYVVLLVAGSAPLWLGIYVMQLNSLRDIALCWSVIGATILLCIATGLFCSGLTRRSSSATALAYGTLFLIGGATLLPYLDPTRFAPALRVAILRINPFVAAIGLMNAEQGAPEDPTWPAYLAVALTLSAVFLAGAWFQVWRLYRNTEASR